MRAPADDRRLRDLRLTVERLWFVTNPASGSSGADKCAAIEAVFAECGLELAGRTEFPAADLPEGAALDRRGVDTLVLFAGDGTINAAACAYADWPGDLLILPGGTMNLLARRLHGAADAAAIVRAAHRQPRRVALPFVEAGPHRAFVGLILGPAAHWVRAREAARAGRWRRVVAAVRGAWQRSFGRGLRVDVPGLARHYQAVLVTPGEGALDVAAIEARDWRSIAGLGWNWITGDWLAARAVETRRVARLALRERRPVLALFDGEPQLLDPAIRIFPGRSAERFLATA